MNILVLDLNDFIAIFYDRNNMGYLSQRNDKRRKIDTELKSALETPPERVSKYVYEKILNDFNILNKVHMS